MTTFDWTPVRTPEALGRTIRRARQEKGMTQAELGERAAATRQSIVGLEAGRETRALQLLFDALAVLGLEVAVRPRQR
jgi:HTH-type transcriptional regulator/antitoxin HipB